MTDFYQNYLTDKSYQLLINLRKKYQFILIGGWAVYFYTQSLKSKDIDIIIDFSELEKIKKEFFLEKNERLKKYQVKIEEIDVDIYLPFYSFLGLPAEEIIKKTTVVDNFYLAEKEILLITKIFAYKNRQGSIKGEKDLLDIFSLLFLDDFDFKYFLKVIKQYKLKNLLLILTDLLKETKSLEDLNLNQHKLAKKKREILERLV
ncbi:MAG: hypothetical protein NZM02_00355 [Patescibacteria group bacterium]|nr:hypothetical protein [Patescibacteria group bacterium]